MASKQRIFTRNKPLMNIYSGLDHEGKQVEVREDAEQLVKWHEIADSLVAAGYYRAQLQGLSAFDKIVGGLSWCIELCDIDVDISLLFEENLTIGKKIALTEKIVQILPSIKCPHIIEPHQIQGLDFINIHPLIQWLIKYSSEFREAKEDELRKFAVMQYDKDYIFESDRETFRKREKMMKNILFVQPLLVIIKEWSLSDAFNCFHNIRTHLGAQLSCFLKQKTLANKDNQKPLIYKNMYKPCRVRKRKGSLPSTELEQVNATLAEYDQRILVHVTAKKDDSKADDGLDFLYDYEKTLADPSDITTDTYKIMNDNETQSDSNKAHFAILHSELTGELSKELEELEKRKYHNEIERLTQAIDRMKGDADNVKQMHEKRMADTKEQYCEIVAKLQSITDKLMKSGNYSNKDVKNFYKSLKELAKERNELLQVISHKEIQLKKCEDELSLLKDPNNKLADEPLTPDELKAFQERETKLNNFIANMKLELGKVNRDILRYTMAADEVPGPAELLQYEKRFVELYNQVASKHKETKQYYIFYNTLYEVKLYTSKELSLLNSIIDNYDEAMSSTRKREEFMKQFESIVDWVNKAVKKVEQKYLDEKENKSQLHIEYSRLMDVQRQYAATLKRLAEARQKKERESS